MLKNIFLDLDDTILNFTAGRPRPFPKRCGRRASSRRRPFWTATTSSITAHWELLEEGRLTRDEVLVQRFEQLFRELGVDHSGKAISERYEVPALPPA